jgi:hypothetical protein
MYRAHHMLCMSSINKIFLYMSTLYIMNVKIMQIIGIVITTLG